ncbi:Flp family type IVb pilin [Neomegalonema perideroedes]|uniref:Flp family type IVb pilin n=1 Tax=Neomegalonema perideroedes TaxID=217219 RepID=UPI00037137D2|nr:Flp family type IVb pilin [Neomegalonema perideroedes]
MLKIKEFVRNEEGATAIEYSVLGSMMALVTIAAGHAMSGAMDDMYTNGVLMKVLGPEGQPTGTP